MTYEEISTKYPVGKLLARTIEYVDHTGYWCGQEDKEFYLTHYDKVRFYDTGYVEYRERTMKEYRVQGWVVDSEGFFVAENTWDGWVPLDDDELAEIEARGIAFDITEF